MDAMHIWSRRAIPKVNVKQTITGARQAYKIHKQVQEAKSVFQSVNNTIHKAAPLIEHAFDAVSARLAKKKESTTYPSLFTESTPFIYQSSEKSQIHSIDSSSNFSNKRSNFYDNIFGKKNWSSQKIMLGVITLGVILILVTLLLTRLFVNKNNNQIRYTDEREILETDSGRRSIDSTGSSLQD